MARRNALAATHFAVSILVAVPEAGFGAQFDTMQAWLKAQLGSDAFSVEGQSGGEPLLFRFLDAAAAKAFVDRFACGVMRSIPLWEDRQR